MASAPHAQRLTRVAGGVLVAVVLGLVFLAYLQPDMAVQLAQQLWACL